jgi:hypothetical protein
MNKTSWNEKVQRKKLLEDETLRQVKYMCSYYDITFPPKKIVLVDINSFFIIIQAEKTHKQKVTSKRSEY